MQDKNQLYDSVTAQIITALESENLPPWRKPWAGGVSSLPLRHEGQAYRGVNVLILWIMSQIKALGSPYWMTFRQAQEYGGCVRKGEKGTHVIWCEPRTKLETADDGTEAESRFWITKSYCVFNAEQIDGLPDRFSVTPTATLDEAQRIDHAETFLKNTGADIRTGGGQAFYRPSQDYVQLPAFEYFTSPETYYATGIHELAHWTGAPHRLNRPQGMEKEVYAQEELIADIASAFACAHLGLQVSVWQDFAPYLEFWLKALKADRRHIFFAAAQAQRACDHLLNLQPKPQ